MRLERKMTRVQKMRFGVRQIATVRAGTFRWEDDVVLAPHDQRPRLIRPEEGLKLRVQWHIRPVVVEEIHLDFPVPRAIQAYLVQDPGRRIEQRATGHDVLVLPARRLRLDQEVKGCSVLGPWVGPVFLEGIPELAQALVVAVTVVADKRLP